MLVSTLKGMEMVFWMENCVFYLKDKNNFKYLKIIKYL
jgi:hypothetical protein